MNNMEILQELRNFEKQEESKLDNIQTDSLKRIEQVKKDIDKKLNEEKTRLQEKKEAEVLKTKDAAKEEAIVVTNDYQKRIGQLKSKSSKNFDKAVDKIFSAILK